jgi:RNA polymerase sigma-70 factor (ECF subfamily)
MIAMKTTESLPTDSQVNEIELVERARRGDKQSLNTLAAIARERLRVYVYRLTQKDDLTQDIVQESLLEMCKILGKLQKTDRFWPWLYGIATNKLHRHYRSEKARRHAAASEERRRGQMKEREEGFEELVSEELKHIVANAMDQLRTRHKAVLVMRCYDGMSYDEIAESMGCSEFSIRMLFVRAKRSLQKELLRHGFQRGALLSALVVFGKMTAPSKAAAAQLTVPAVALKVGLVAGVAGRPTTTTGLVSLTAAGALTLGTVATTTALRSPADTPLEPRDTQVRLVSPYATSAAAHEQYWYYFPEGPQGPVMIRARSTTPDQGPEPQVLQNDRGNYSQQAGTLHINNYHMLLDDGSVFKLPTDSTELRGFLAEVEGVHNDLQPVRAGGRGLLVVVQREPQNAASKPWTIRYSNVLNEDYFQGDWPTNIRIADHRDAMHERGWTYFRVRGQVHGQKVVGAGQIPFVYDAAREHGAWLRLKVGGDVVLLDSGAAAVLRDAQGTTRGKYPRGSFFKGLSRPWMGLHVLDTVRRDAAEERLRFETRLLSDGRQVEVTVLQGKTTLTYTIDIEADLVRRIAFTDDHAAVGALEFEYLENTDATSGEFTAPRVRDERVTLRESPGLLWLVRLAQGTLGG